MVESSVRAFEGACHCGALRYVFRTARPPTTWPVNACQCTFCRAHGARTTTDPAGSVAFRINDESQVQRYRFGLRTADFLVCRNCGVYIAAVFSSPGGTFATLNVNALCEPLALPDALPVSYNSERVDERCARREERWTPVDTRDCAQPPR